MQMVIEIPGEVYGLLKYFEKAMGLADKKEEDDDVKTALIRAVVNGIQLPKVHGRLMILSEDKLKENQINLDFSCQKWISEVGLSYATVAIIEADTESEDKE